MPEGLSLEWGSRPAWRAASGGEAAGDGARDERGALFLQPFDQGLLFRHQCVDFRGLAVEEVGDGALFGG